MGQSEETWTITDSNVKMHMQILADEVTPSQSEKAPGDVQKIAAEVSHLSDSAKPVNEN